MEKLINFIIGRTSLAYYDDIKSVIIHYYVPKKWLKENLKYNAYSKYQQAKRDGVMQAYKVEEFKGE